MKIIDFKPDNYYARFRFCVRQFLRTHELSYEKMLKAVFLDAINFVRGKMPSK
jgi:hypothetical protein